MLFFIAIYKQIFKIFRSLVFTHTSTCFHVCNCSIESSKQNIPSVEVSVKEHTFSLKFDQFEIISNKELK